MVGQPDVDAGQQRGGAVFSGSQSSVGVAAADLGFDGVEIADEGRAFLGNRRGPGAGDLDQLTAGMGPAIRQLDARTDPVRCDQAVVSGIAVDLQDAAEALQYPFGVLSSPTGGVGEGYARRQCAAPRSVVASQSPEVSGLGLSGPGVEDGARVSSMKSLVDRFRSAISASWTGRSSK